MDHVQSEQQWNVQPRLLDRNVLILVNQRGVDDVEQRPDLSPGDHFFVVGSSRAGACRLAGGVLHQLPNFFFQCHALEQGLDAGVKVRVRDRVGTSATPDHRWRGCDGLGRD